MGDEALSNIISRGEDSKHQFKEDINNSDQLAAELVAFSNSEGGMLVVGVEDKSLTATGLTDIRIQSLNNMIANVTTDKVKPSISVLTEIVQIGHQKVLAIHVKPGINKPYCDYKGSFWMKNGANKRKITSPEELQRIFQVGDKLYADEQPLLGTSIEDLDAKKVDFYLSKRTGKTIDEIGLPLERLFENLRVMKAGHATLGGLLTFGISPQFIKPIFIVKAIAFYGNEVTTLKYRDSQDIEGDLRAQYDGSLSFLKRTLRHVQNGKSVNSVGDLEIPVTVFEELVQNALVHRDYFRLAPVRLFVFDNRVEIISPGVLPNGLEVENIKFGSTVVRNPLIVSFASQLLPYRGIGTGVRRAMAAYPGIDFVNDTQTDSFKVIIPRLQEQH